MIALVGVLLGLSTFCEAQLQEKISADQLTDIHKQSGLDKSVAFRCGLFFPDPKNDNGLPIAPLFIFNSSWSAPECPDGGQDRFTRFCDSIVRPVSERLTLADPSLYKNHADLGLSIGDDICGVLKRKVNAPFVGPGPPVSKKFPNGIKFGMYTNQCGEEKWHDTGFRHWELICCANGEYKKCP